VPAPDQFLPTALRIALDAALDATIETLVCFQPKTIDSLNESCRQLIRLAQSEQKLTLARKEISPLAARCGAVESLLGYTAANLALIARLTFTQTKWTFSSPRSFRGASSDLYAHPAARAQRGSSWHP
jgi:hypothetical protein